ncbi:MAG: response regulator [Thiobacillaceae bacterium]|nr:response regulator [Thiobacillaceae bacterium]
MAAIVPFRERRHGHRVNPREGTRFLIIDDSPTIGLALRKMLGSVGYQTLIAPNVEEGLEMARSELPDLVFLDIVLPGMNGFAALRALRRDSRTRDIPVILMSGDEEAINQFYASALRADAFMRKPFTRSELFGHIERLLDAQRTPRRLKRAGRVEGLSPA